MLALDEVAVSGFDALELLAHECVVSRFEFNAANILMDVCVLRRVLTFVRRLPR